MSTGNWKNSSEPFQSWLVEMRYAEKKGGKIHAKISDGLIVYMWEAWQEAQSQSAPVIVCKHGQCVTPSACFEHGEQC
tara:strand:- start:643 stop:876 length:234 start_codon:yes stop_codon:yes gene_type:complete